MIEIRKEALEQALRYVSIRAAEDPVKIAQSFLDFLTQAQPTAGDLQARVRNLEEWAKNRIGCWNG